MGGKGFINSLRAKDPKAKVIASSGYANDPVMSAYREYGFSGIIAKPYSLTAFSTVIARVIGETPAETDRGTGNGPPG
jgi:hypothetical protein